MIGGYEKFNCATRPLQTQVKIPHLFMSLQAEAKEHVIASEAKQSNVEGIFGQAKNSTPYFQRGRIRI